MESASAPAPVSSSSSSSSSSSRHGSSRERHSSSTRRSSPRRRSRSRSRDRRSSKRHSRSRSRDRRPSSSSYSSSSRRSKSPVSHSSSSRRRGAPTPEEIAEQERLKLERDERTVFVQQIHPRVEEMDLVEYFSACGQVDDVRILKDPRTNRSRGLAYIEFNKKDSVIAALALSGQELAGFPITVTIPVNDKRPTTTKAAAEGPFRISFSNLHPIISEKDIIPIFQAFGEIDRLEIERDRYGNYRGVGYVLYKSKIDAVAAHEHLQGLELCEKLLSLSADFNIEEAKRYSTPEPITILPPTTIVPTVPIAPALPMHSIPLMNPATIQPPTCYVRLSNMFDDAIKAEPEWNLDIHDDVLEECQKLGQTVRVVVDATSAEGAVYVHMADLAGAAAVILKMNGRTFSGKTILADYVASDFFNLIAGRYPQ